MIQICYFMMSFVDFFFQVKRNVKKEVILKNTQKYMF